MLGFGRKNGFYVGFRSDFGSASGELECNEAGVISGSEQTAPPFYKEGSTHSSRMSITGGYFRKLARSFYLYAGAGYGTRSLTYELAAPVTIDGKEYAEGTEVKDTDKSAIGVAAELGGIVTFGKFCVSLGYHTVNFKYHEVTGGIGLIF